MCALIKRKVSSWCYVERNKFTSRVVDSQKKGKKMEKERERRAAHYIAAFCWHIQTMGIPVFYTQLPPSKNGVLHLYSIRGKIVNTVPSTYVVFRNIFSWTVVRTTSSTFNTKKSVSAGNNWKKYCTNVHCIQRRVNYWPNQLTMLLLAWNKDLRHE